MHAYEPPAHEMHTREMYSRDIYAHRSVAFLGDMAVRVLQGGAPNRGIYARQPRRRRPASSNTMSTPKPHRGQNAAVLLSRSYVFAAFGDRWPGVAFLILALSGNFGTWALVTVFRAVGKSSAAFLDASSTCQAAASKLPNTAAYGVLLCEAEPKL
jgi:hypothetical protein